jgi:hypothetical protein
MPKLKADDIAPNCLIHGKQLINPATDLWAPSRPQRFDPH